MILKMEENKYEYYVVEDKDHIRVSEERYNEFLVDGKYELRRKSILE